MTLPELKGPSLPLHTSYSYLDVPLGCTSEVSFLLLVPGSIPPINVLFQGSRASLILRLSFFIAGLLGRSVLFLRPVTHYPLLLA